MSAGAILPIFLASGFSALIYQVVWQRALFAVFGINAESVTVVVTVFMVGLGLGALGGGALSSRRAVAPLLVFAAAEAGVGVFGLASLEVIRRAGHATLTWSGPAIAAVIFLILLVPTLLMGATLPLLVGHLVRRWANVGRSVAALYAANTLGSAVAAVAVAFVLQGALGQQGSVTLAALVNLAVSAAALALWRAGGRSA